MKELVETVVTSYNDYRGTGKLLALFLVSVLIICLLNGKDDKEGKRVFSPARFILCPPAGIGYAFTRLYRISLIKKEDGSNISRIAARVITGIFIVLALMLSGRWVFSQTDHYRTENRMHIRQAYVDVMDTMLAGSDNVIRVCAPPGLSPYMKAYSKRFDVLYAYPKNGDPSYLEGDARYVYEQMLRSTPDQGRVVEALRNASCSYIVYDTSKTYFELPFEEFDYELVCEVSGYRIYRDKTISGGKERSGAPDGIWTLVTFASCFAFAIVCLFITFGKKEKKGRPDAFSLLVTALIICQVVLLYMTSSDDPAYLPPGLYGKIGFTILYTVLPVIMIPAYYLAYHKLACRLFDDKRSIWLMLFALCVLNLWGYQSALLAPAAMLCGYYSLPSVFIHGVFPLLLSLVPDRADDISAGEDNDLSDYYKWEEEDMKNHKIINSRNLAIALLVVVLMLLGSVFIMNRKINSLYQTTVNLQEQVEELKKSE